MSDLAGRRTHLRSNIRRPAPAWFEDHSADGGLVEIDHVHPAATKITRVFRSAEVLSLQPWHAAIVPGRLARTAGSGWRSPLCEATLGVGFRRRCDRASNDRRL